MGQDAVEALAARARVAAELPIVRRAHRYEDVGRHRTWLDGRAKGLEDEIRETFALAMSDHVATRVLAEELPLLAAAFRATGDQRYGRRALEQLEEVASWSPIQRPGWSCCAPGARLPPDGKDGNWLATGQGIRAIADVLDILPAGTVGPALRERIDELLRSEIEGIVDDWRTRRPWFVRRRNPITNQWVLPTEGLVRACLVLGRERHRDAYELGVTNLLAALGAHGSQGEFEEGIGYASFTVSSILNAARAMALAGDGRAMEQPFLQRFPTWMVHHIQPGRMAVNCFDAGGAALPRVGSGFAPLLSLFVLCTGSSAARWALRTQFDAPSDDLAGLLSRSLLARGEDPAPPLFAAYDRARRLNWRDSWRDDATGVWVRGGHEADQHDHQDRGHVNFISRGRPILIEAGTPAYHHPELSRLFATGVGHNVLQLGLAMPERGAARVRSAPPAGWQKARAVAGLRVERLDGRGGEADVDGTAAYDGLDRWRRHVSWSAGTLNVRDDVALAAGRTDTVLFRWHLGTAGPVEVSGHGNRWRAEWADAVIGFEASEPVEVSQTALPDHTLRAVGWDDDIESYPRHVCLEVRSASAVRTVRVSTTVTPTDATAER